MRVSDVARELGVSADWLRRLERQGRLIPARRDVNGYRRYTTRDVSRVRAVLFGEYGSRASKGGK